MMKAHPWERCPVLSIGANVGTCSKVVGVTRHTRILVMGKVWDREEVLRYDHLRGYSRAEFLDLAADVAQECIPGPSANQHDGENGDTGKVHGHGSSQLDGVGAKLKGRVSKVILTNGLDSCTKSVQ